MSTNYTYLGLSNPNRLSSEIIAESEISATLSHITVSESLNSTTIVFESPLSYEEKIILDGIFIVHTQPATARVIGKDWQNILEVDQLGRLLSKAYLQIQGEDISQANPLPSQSICDTSFVTAEKTSDSEASIAQVGETNLANRKFINIYNTSNIVIYVGSDTVTTSGATRGRPIRPESDITVSLGPNVDLYVISASSASYVVTEGS